MPDPERCLLPDGPPRGRAGKWLSAAAAVRRFAVLALGAGLLLAPGSPRAQALEGGSEEREARQSGAEETAGDSPAGQGLVEKRDERQRRLLAWWEYTREVLFADLELSPEQLREVDALIEAQLSARMRLEEVDTELRMARRQGDQERSRALLAQRRALDARLAERHELMEAMRALLTDEQRPVFDMNRARLVAEGQKARKSRGVP